MAIDNIADKIRAARELREHLLSDRHRPGYHFAMPEDIGRPGDPNGAFYADGRYHLMYLYDRRGVDGWKGKGYAWGHISSGDLVHWRHHPDALLPDDYDGGIFSGGAFLDDDGTAYLTYWRVNEVNEGTGIGIARSSDRHYEHWEKLRVPSLDGTEFGIREAAGVGGGIEHVCNADPSNIWKHNGTYYLQAGNLLVLNKLGRNEQSPAHYRGDWVDLFRSRDLREWEYVHRSTSADATTRGRRRARTTCVRAFCRCPVRALAGRPAASTCNCSSPTTWAASTTSEPTTASGRGSCRKRTAA